MSLPHRFEDRKRSDRQMERELRIRTHDPTADTYGGRIYSPADIQALEEEMVPWLRRKRRKRS